MKCLLTTVADVIARWFCFTFV